MIARKKVKYIVCLFSLIFLINTVTYDYVEANSIGLTLASLASNSGGLAAFGSAALGVVVPLVMAAGTVYAGYKIYQNRDKIMNAFHSWYNSASSVVKDWSSNLANLIEKGVITDGSTISIPKEVMQEVSKFYEENVPIPVAPNGEFIRLSSLAANVHELSMRSWLQLESNNELFSYAPIIDAYVKTGDNIYPERLYYGSHNDTYGLILYRWVKGPIYSPEISWVFDYLGPNSFDASGNIVKLGSWAANTYVFNNSVIPTSSSATRLVLPDGNIVRTGNHFSCDTWDYDLDIYIPSNSEVLFSDKLVQVDNRDRLIEPLTIDEFTEMPFDIPTTKVLDNVIPSDEAYNPTLDNTGALEVPLTPEIINALNDYIVKKNTGEIELVRALDPAGFDKDEPGNGEVGVVDGILNGISDFFSKPLANILSFLKSILDAILSIPSAISAIPGQFTDWWEKLWEKIQDIIDTIGDLPGSVATSIQNAFEWLFVPDGIAVKEFVDHMRNKIDGQTGLLSYPLSLVIIFLNKVLTLSSNDCILTIPDLKIMNYKILEQHSFNFSQFVRKSEYSTLYKTYIDVTNFILILAVINLAIKKGDQMIRGR